MEQRQRDMCVAIDLGVANAFEKLIFSQTEAEKLRKEILKLERGVFPGKGPGYAAQKYDERPSRAMIPKLRTLGAW